VALSVRDARQVESAYLRGRRSLGHPGGAGRGAQPLRPAGRGGGWPTLSICGRRMKKPPVARVAWSGQRASRLSRRFMSALQAAPATTSMCR
jgi:hypothetical protein